MAKLTQEELLAQFEDMTLLELSGFVKAFEEKFEVEAAAPVAAVAVGGAAGGA
ncbi:50S ribosomal protein L7, partial [Streptomyces varsoviensis]